MVDVVSHAFDSTTRLHSRKRDDVGLPKPESAAPTEELEAHSTAGPVHKDQGLLDEVASKHASLATATLYDLLDVSPKSVVAEITKAYYAAIKKFHPDHHHSPSLRSARGLLEELCAKFAQAFEVLSDSEKRKRYDETLQSVYGPDASDRTRQVEPGKAPASSPKTSEGATDGSTEPKDRAKQCYLQAKVHYNDMAYFDAVQCLREAVRLDSGQATYHKLLANALSRNPKWIDAAETHFKKALELDPSDKESYLELAAFYEATALTARAIKIYQKVLELDPDDTVAREKLSGRSARPGESDKKDG